VPNTAAHARWRDLRVAMLAALVVGSAACGSDPFNFQWSDAPDTVLLYSLARPEVNAAAGYSFYQGQVVQISAPGASGSWDVALDTRNQSLVLLPPGALGISARAAIATLPGVTLEDVTKAPSDTLLYSLNDPVPVVAGSVYVVRTNRQPGSFGQSCVYYVKVEPLVIDVPNGTLTFRYVDNPVCNSLDLVPPK
jgi:hypothetical protein